MADSTTPIQQITAGTNADARVNENFDAASPAMLYGRRASTTTGLTWGYYGGRYRSTSISNGTVALTGSATNYVVAAKATGTVSVSTSTTNWDDTQNYERLYLIVTGASSITSYQDHRQLFSGVGLSFGATTTESGANRDISSSDAGRYIRMTDVGANTVTFRPNSTHALPADSEFHIRCAGGNTTLTPGSGVTLNAPAGGTLVLSSGMTVTVKRVASDVFDVIGQTVPA